jgi:hypothetical protein
MNNKKVLLKNYITNQSIIRLKQQFNAENMDDKPFSKQFKFIEYIPNFPVEELLSIEVPKYQRDIQFHRLNNICTKMYSYGYDNSRPIMISVNKDIMFSHDGSHRALCAYILGLKTVPVILAEFKDIKHAADHFAGINRPEGGSLLPKERINSDYMCGYPYAKLVYKLSIDTNSLFKNYVDLKGTPKKLASNRITMPGFLKVFNWVVLEYRRRWEQDINRRLNDIADKLTYSQALEAINEFGDWFFEISGRKTSPTNNTAFLHKDKGLTSLLQFWFVMKKSTERYNYNFEDLKESTIAFLKLYPWLTSAAVVDISQLPSQLISGYNSLKMQFLDSTFLNLK